ncbi:uncharacterized protein LOC108026602 [Drosophila biarmipes]|uniref:uncharacterized protein LOC108026602 n=1 Tax=Drosophila biarmipes TaxID=125945 RepID=UPI0007E7B26C|nr:uncharacterized protein LOC108026602 [Drosophila biarmipes]
MSNNLLLSVGDNILSKGNLQDLNVPPVGRINDIREYMSNPENFNGNINELTERLEADAEQCRNIIKILKDRINLKIATLKKIREDVLQLNSEVQKPGAEIRFVTKREKVKLHFLDEAETKEYFVQEALERYSVKMSFLYGEILSLDSDVDHVTYLEGVSKMNVKYVRDWYRTEMQDKNKKPLPESVGHTVGQ